MKNKSKMMFLGIIALMFATSMFLTGCAGQDDDVIKIGVVLPLTGYIADHGKYMQDAFELYLEGVSPELRNKIEIFYEDNKGLPLETSLVLNKLHNIDRVDLVIGPLTGTATRVSEAFAKDNRLLFLSPGDNYGKSSDYFFSVSMLNEEEGRFIAEYMIAENNMNASVLYFNNDWGIIVKNAFIEHYTSLGGKILAIEGHEPTDSDYRSALFKLINENPDAIFIGWAPLAIKQLYELDKNITIYTVRNYENDDIKEVYGMYSEGVRYPSPIKSSDERYLIFKENFVEKYGYEPPYTSTISYIAMGIAFEIIETCGKDRGCLQKELLNSSRQSMLGDISFNEKSWGLDIQYEHKIFKNGTYVLNQIN